MKLKLGENFFPHEPKMVDGRIQYGADFTFTSKDILEPIPGVDLSKCKPIKDLLALIEKDINASSSDPTPATPKL